MALTYTAIRGNRRRYRDSVASGTTAVEAVPVGDVPEGHRVAVRGGWAQVIAEGGQARLQDSDATAISEVREVPTGMTDGNWNLDEEAHYDYQTPTADKGLAFGRPAACAIRFEIIVEFVK